MSYDTAQHTVTGAYDYNGDFFPLDSLDTTITRDGSGNPLTIVATRGRVKWTKTFTYTNGYLTNTTAWVKN